jgi:transcriptional regulator with GAF, ATPase, and Fis domain
MASLIVKGPDGAERRVALVKRLTTVGRDPENDVAVADPALPATALHIHSDGSAYDAAAHDGAAMTVNGRRRGAWRLGPGDRIRVGSTELLFDPVTRVAPAEPAARAPGAGPVIDLQSAREALIRFSERLLAATDLSRLLDELLEALVEVTQADKGFVLLLQDGEITVRAARNVAREAIDGAVSRVSDSIVRRVIETGRSLVVADALHDDEWSGSTSVVNLRLCSVMCAPLKQKGEVFGLIYLGNDDVVSLFDQRALDLLTVFAAQASLLVQNGLLLDSLRRENSALREAVTTKQYGELIGSGGSMREVFRRIEKVASTDVSVLITGETGSGKEVVAREIHRRSPRAAGPFVAVNCGAIPENLLESELFGHVKGAFTGAVASRIGRFQAAGGGTLFLDEIGDMPPGLQVKILRALQEHAVTRVGDSRPEPVDLRVVAATNRVLEQEIQRGAFREDLYYRLNVVSIELPPLRERGEDMVVLARYFLTQYAREFSARVRGFTPGALVALKKYAWPGNVRELENRIKKAVVLAERAMVSAEDLDLRADVLEPIAPLSSATREFQKRYVNDVLDRNGGNRTKTAKDLGVDPRTIFRHLERMEAERRGEPPPPEEEPS